MYPMKKSHEADYNLVADSVQQTHLLSALDSSRGRHDIVLPYRLNHGGYRLWRIGIIRINKHDDFPLRI